MSFAKLYDNILLIDFDTILNGVLSSLIVANSIRGMQYEQIYKQGINAKGERISPNDALYKVYSPWYTEYKKSYGIYQSYVDLSFSGEFLQTLRIEFENNQLLIYYQGYQVSEGNLADILRSRYGADIEGLTTDNFNKLCKNIILPLLQIDCFNALKTALQP